MAETSPPNSDTTSSPAADKRRGSHSKTATHPRTNKNSERKEVSDRRTRSGTRSEMVMDRYMAPSYGLTVWTEDWEFKDTIGITKTKYKPFEIIFGENDSIHEALKIKHKTGIPNKSGYIHTVSFWKELFLEGCDKKTTFKLNSEEKN